MPQDSKPDADADVTLGVVYQEPSGASEGHGAPDVAADPTFRYDLREMIAQGGIGEVYLADDRTLGRQVAVKILQSRYHTGSAVANRFVDEARISAQLQHPGIPPIHDLGTLPGGRPFLAMKLIKGQTLGDLVAERPNPGADRGRFLAAFEQVCQAVAYAHARRVIHRDLKPQNIMVGSFGEVQVMDWGLAKVLGRPTGQTRPSDSEEGMATEILSARDDSDGSQTQSGSVLGTPAYMAPEQAVGAVEQVDERSDVFGLGAVLAVILTGQPPYVGDNSETIRVLAARGKLDDCFARLDASGAESELVALCKSCLNPERDDRPSDADAVARAIALFRAEAEERARQAELDRVRAEGDRARIEAETRAERQKRRARRAVAVGALALLVVGASAALIIRNQAEGRRNDADRLASVALGRAEELEAQAGAIDPAELFEANAAVKLLEQAEAAVAQAESAVAGVGGADVRARAGEAARSVRSRLAGSRRDARLLAALENAEGADAGTAGGLIDDQEKRRLYHSAFEGAGLPAGGDPTTLAAAVRAERPGLRGALLKALDRWHTSAFYRANPTVDRVRAAADLVDGDPVRREIRAAIAGGCEALNRLAGRLSALDLPPPTAVLIGEALVLRCRSYREGARILQHAWEKSPSDRTLLRDLAWALSEGYPTDPVRIEESVGYARTLIALNPDNAVGHFVLGQILQYGKRDPKSAESQYRRTIELNPRFTLAMNNLGYILRDRGDDAGAEQLFRRTVEVDPGDVFSRKIFASLLRQKGDLAAAEAEFHKLVELDPKDLGSARALDRVRRAADLLPRLDDVVSGRSAPATPAEGLEFARLCALSYRRQYAAAARLFDGAFAGDPKLAEVPDSVDRYNAACAALLASIGRGVDGPDVPAERAALRGKALAWLRAELAVRAAQADSDQPAERKASADKLSLWLSDADLAMVRAGDPQLNLLADERPAWESFWADVRATIEAATKPVQAAKAISNQ